MAEDGARIERRRVVVSGRVQGVFFRECTRREAEAAGVSGWVRNRDDGTVEAVFEGERSAVEPLLDWVRDGPRQADVDHVEVTPEGPEGLDGFVIR